MKFLSTIIVLFVILIFSILLIISFVVYPEIGEKILYGKHPSVNDLEKGEIKIKSMEQNKTKLIGYSGIMTSGNYKCIEDANRKSKGDLNKFVNEFNNCNSE